MRFTKIFLVFTLLLESVVAFGKAPQCEHVFFPTVYEILWEHPHRKFLFADKDFQEFTKDYSWWRRRQIRKTLQSIEIQNFTSEQALQRYAAELSIALFGERTIVDRWIRQSQSERLEESAVLLIKEQLLQEGLLHIWKDQHNPPVAGVVKKSLDFLENMPKTRWAYLQLPWSLPQARDHRISPELMTLVIRDGFQNHAMAVQKALGSQDRIEAYNSFRKIYGAVFFASIVSLHMIQAYQMIEWEQERLVEAAMQELKQTQENIRNFEKLKNNTIEMAYQETLKAFKDRWGEEPTPAEAKALRLKIEVLIKDE